MAKLSSLVDRPIRLLETGEAKLEVRDLNTDELLGFLVFTWNGAPELYDTEENFFDDDL